MMEAMEKRDTDSFQQCQMIGQEAIDTKYKNIKLGTGCPERLQSLHLWRYSKPNWVQFWVTCSMWLCLSSEVWLVDLQRSLSVWLWTLGFWQFPWLHDFKHQKCKVMTSNFKGLFFYFFTPVMQRLSSVNIYQCTTEVMQWYSHAKQCSKYSWRLF